MANYYKCVCKLDNAGLMQDIEESLLSMRDTEEESITDVLLYSQDHADEVDFMIAQHGNLLIGFNDVFRLYREHGLTTVDDMPINVVWEMYRRDVGIAARRILNNHLLELDTP